MKAEAFIQVVIGIMFSFVGFFIYAKENNLPILIFSFIGIVFIVNGIWTQNPKKIPAFAVGIPFSLMFLFAAYLSLISNMPIYISIPILPLDIITGPVKISQNAARYSMVIIFIIASLFPFKFFHIKTFMKERSISYIAILYILISLSFIIFPSFYMLMIEKNKSGLTLFFNWVIITIVVFVYFNLSKQKKL